MQKPVPASSHPAPQQKNDHQFNSNHFWRLHYNRNPEGKTIRYVVMFGIQFTFSLLPIHQYIKISFAKIFQKSRWDINAIVKYCLLHSSRYSVYYSTNKNISRFEFDNPAMRLCGLVVYTCGCLLLSYGRIHATIQTYINTYKLISRVLEKNAEKKVLGIDGTSIHFGVQLHGQQAHCHQLSNHISNALTWKNQYHQILL